jgi:hypothetical protein
LRRTSKPLQKKSVWDFNDLRGQALRRQWEDFHFARGADQEDLIPQGIDRRDLLPIGDPNGGADPERP